MGKHYDFIEVGTSDFDTLIENANENSIGITIEPIGYYLNKLPNKNNVKKIQAGLSDHDGVMDIFYIPDEEIVKHNLKWWVRGSNSIGKPHPFAMKELGEDFYNSIVKIEKIPVISWKSLVENEDIGSIDFLKIDTEGHDHVILNDYLKLCSDNPSLLANKIKFERHPEVSNIQEIDFLISKFKNYKIEYLDTDVVLTKIKIPKIIHQTFKTNDFPDEIKKSIQSLKDMNPDYEYRFYDNNDCLEFIKQNYDKETLNLYESINPNYGSARADFFRYLLMYKVGGVYLDLKSSTTKPLNETILPTDEYLLTHWMGRDWSDLLNYYHGEFQNWHIICRPNHPFLKKTIELVKQNIKNYKGEKGKLSVLSLTGPIVYSKAIISLLDKFKTNHTDSPVREFKLENEIGLSYLNLSAHHHNFYGKNHNEEESIILKKNPPSDKEYDKSFVYLVDEKYLDIAKSSVKSIREFSQSTILVYLINSDKKIDIPNVKTIRWDVPQYDTDDSMYNISGSNFYINRANKKIYQILIQRIKVVQHALENYSKLVAYVDSDSVATPYVDRIFDMFDNDSSYPYFVEGINDWFLYNGRGGAESMEDLSGTLEHPACELFNINQYVRKRYRQTGYFVAGQNTIDFLEEWFWYCIHPKVLKDNEWYAPYNEETILNVLLYKHNIHDGLPYLYVNGTLDTIDEVYTKLEFKGPNVRNHIRPWFRLPQDKETLLFFHGEKNPKVMDEMVKKIKYHHENRKIKLLFLAPHLSTGGMPGFLLKMIELLKEYHPEFDMYVIEYSNYGDKFSVQKNRIKEIVTKHKYWTLGEDKYELINIIDKIKPDLIHVQEMIEGFDSFNRMPSDLISQVYRNDRTWRMVETCHNVWFSPENKVMDPEAYAFCTPYHKEDTFKKVPSYGEVIQFPIEDRKISSQEKMEAKKSLGFDLDKTHVINVGLWTSGKNQKEGVEIARLCENENIQFHFIGNYAENFKSYWEPVMKNLPSNVKIWGERNDVDNFMKAADVFMFNSTWECNPLVLRESISYGLKVLARNLPQYLDMFTEFITEINDDILVTKSKLLELISKDVDYDLPKGQDKVFSDSYSDLYKKALTIPIKQQKFKTNLEIIQYFINNPYLEIRGTSPYKYKILFYDEVGKLHYSSTISSNSWVKLNREYFTKWRTEIWEEDELIYNKVLDYKDKRVFISFGSKSLGDNVAWIPYVKEFQEKHSCKVIVSTFWNHLFKDVYPELEFVEPGSTVSNIHGMYCIGWYYNENKEPVRPNTIPLQKAATNILGLDFKEIKSKVHYEIKERPYPEKYITIATNSTSGCKFWTREGWQELINYLTDLGYKVVNVSKEENPFENQTRIKDTSIENTMNVIHHSEFFIGLSSGLSWLSWAMGKKVVMISNFTESDHEFTEDCIRITNPNVCNSCWNNPDLSFDRGDWNWCPFHKGTPRQFECHTSITSKMVIDKIESLLK
jgi:autotransporter strand-loop-strand O-heptosyltransferase